MATKLYETLGVLKDATMDEIRKAYKKKALQTHPDRLPQGATPDDKAKSEEHFRLVNNAYEILTDPQKRKAYDKYGVFPPPEPERARSRTDYDGRRRHGHPFNEPFVSTTFVFTDPFTLFDEIFGQEFPQWRDRRSRFRGPSTFMGVDPFFSPFPSPFSRSLGGLLATMEQDLFGMPSAFPSHSMLRSHAYSTLESPSQDRRDGRFMQESYMTQTINGVSQTVHKRVDVDGNEHITRTYPDGRKFYTINGVEQPVHGYLPSPEFKDTRNDSRRSLPSRHDPRSSSSNQVLQAAPQPQPIHAGRSDYPVTPPPQYPGTSYSTSPPVDHIYRNRSHRSHYERHPVDNGYDVYPDANRRIYDDDDRHHNHRRRQWPGHW